MENASKALLIAGGILLAMLVVSLLFFSWGRFSAYYSNQDEFSLIDDVVEFNLQFTGYQGREVYGYELISLSNKIADYNMRFSNAAGARNDERYNKIVIKIDFQGKQDQFRYRNDGTRNSRHSLFVKRLYENQGIENIIETATGIERAAGGSEIATKLSKGIDSLILSDEQIASNFENKNITPIQSKQVALDNFNSIVINQNKIEGYKSNPNLIEKNYDQMVKYLQGEADVMKYYEYYQFKKGIFSCANTDVHYDRVTNRVSEISFKFEKLD